MERRREGTRGETALRRLRISCLKDSADAEARMDETPLIERFRKGNLEAFPVSFAAQVGTTAPAWSKKKRNVLQETQTLLELSNGGNGSLGRTDKVLPEDEVDEAAPLPTFAPFGRSRSKDSAKEGELVMDISNIPRRARSSGSRLSSLRRQVEHTFRYASLQQVPTSHQQRSRSPNLLGKCYMQRPVGRKNRPLQDFRAMGSPQISDQEVEVAEVLFDLSRSKPFVVKSSSLRCEKKSGGGKEDKELESSSSQAVGSSASEHMQKLSCPSFDEPKRKRQRGSVKQEEALETAAAGVGLVGLNELPKNQNAFGEKCKHKKSNGVFIPLCYGDSLLQVVDNKNANHPEQRSREILKAKVTKKNNDNRTFMRKDSVPPGPTICKARLSVQISCKDGEYFKSSISEDRQANGSKSKADLVHFSKNATTEEEGRDTMETEIKRPVSESSTNFSRNGPGTREVVSSGNVVLGTPAPGAESIGRVLSTEGNLKQMLGQLKKEQNDSKVLDIKTENVIGVLDQGAHSACLSHCTLSSPKMSSPKISGGTSNGCPPWSNHGKVASPWLTNAFLLGSNLGRKMSFITTEVPHTKAQPVIKRRRCATHVFVAHYIQQRQQSLRQAFWPLACPSGAAYHSSTLPANLQGNERRSDKNVHFPSMQPGGAPVELCRASKMPSSRGSDARVLDKSSYHARSSPLDLQSPTQQTHSPSRPPRRRVPPSPPQEGFSHSLLAQPHFQPKQQGQEEQQHQHYTAIPSQYHGAGSDGFSGGHVLLGDRTLSTSKQSIHLHQQAESQGQQALSQSNALLLHRLNGGPKVKSVNSAAGGNNFFGISGHDKATGGPAEPDLATSALAATTHGDYDQELRNLGTQHQYCYHRSYPRVPATLSTKSHCNKEQSSLECHSPLKQSSTNGSKGVESCLPMNVTVTCGGPALIQQATVLPNSHHIQKPAMVFVKPARGLNTTTGSSVETTAGGSVENAFAWANLPLTVPPSPQCTVSSNQDVKASHTSGCSNVSHASSLSPEQQVCSNLQSAANWAPHNNFLPHDNFSPGPSCGTFSSAVPHHHL